MNRYKEIAQALYDPNHPLRTFHVSFIVHKRKIISVGVNAPKTHRINLLNPTGRDNDETRGRCSELDAITKLINKTKIDTNKCKLINVRVDRNGDVNISKPCPSCSNLIKYHGFKRVIYTDKNGKFKVLDPLI